MYKFENPVSIKVRSGDTGEILQEWDGANQISDDVLASYGQVFYTNLISGNGPACFLLPDGANWSGFTTSGTWRQEPYAPYCITANNAFNGSAQTQWRYYTTFTAPSNPVTGQAKLFYSWTALPVDFQLKGIGLTGWQSNTSGGNLDARQFGIVSNNPSVFVPQTLVILPTSILVHGISPGGTPDVLEISYFLSIVGVS